LENSRDDDGGNNTILFEKIKNSLIFFPFPRGFRVTPTLDPGHPGWEPLG